MRRLAHPPAFLTALAILAGCEIGETTFAEPEEMIVAEVFIYGDARNHTAFLHRAGSGPGGQGGPVKGASIEVTDPEGRTIRFVEAYPEYCIEIGGAVAIPGGTCYIPAEGGDDALVRPGTTYTLRIELPDGRILTGRTTVPGDFRILTPAPDPSGYPICTLSSDTPVELAWTRSAGAWVYIAEAELWGLARALEPRGIEVDNPYRVLGFAVSENDTTIAFPGEFGIFERFNDREILLAIRDGLPNGVLVAGAIAAADRNYVNWIRGGRFNPSGLVRIPSIAGDGTGVFGSLVVRGFVLDGARATNPPPPPCPAP